MIHSSKVALLTKFISGIPAVKRELHHWSALAQTLPSPLRGQAMLSIEHKAFHCLGGSVYAYYPGADRKTMLRLIVAFQTISDYLDNLCDRMHVTDPQAFRLLHLSITEALTPGAPLSDYYALYPFQERSYLSTLVETCQEILGEIPHYHQTQPTALRLAEYYCELQVLKHSPNGGVLLKDWVEDTFNHALTWNEVAAACGSTLGIFLSMALAFQPDPNADALLADAYFPWIQGLHILLDYLIDLTEDEQNDDLNFVTFYLSQSERNQSLQKIAQESKRRSSELPCPHFHRTTVDGLIALYGSDPKVRQQNQENIIKTMAGEGVTLFMLRICEKLRQMNLI